jgi:hypothetical protein
MRRSRIDLIAAVGCLFLLPAAGGAQVRISLAAWKEPVLLDTMRQNHHLNAKPEVVYQAVMRAFDDLGLPVGRTDGKAGVIGSERFERQRVLAGAPMARSFDCGEGPAGPNANLFRLEIATVAWVSPDETGTKLGLASIASGRDVSGVFRNPKECASTGTLELKLLERVKQLTGG